MASTVEAELGALFHNARDSMPLCTTLIEMGHTQSATPIQTYNAFHPVWKMKPSNNHDPRQLICTFIGYVTASNKANSSYLG
jgi:hypothetical protein